MIIKQVAELQKENFGLKLRIYFLENRTKIPLGDNEENISEMVSELVDISDFLPARRYASAGNSDRNVSVRLSRAGIVSKRRKLAA